MDHRLPLRGRTEDVIPITNLFQNHAGTVRPEHLSLESTRATAPKTAPGTGPALPLMSLRLKDVEEAFVRHALDTCAGNRSLAARELGTNRTTLYAKLKVYGLE